MRTDAQVTYLHQAEEVGVTQEDRRQARRALVGTCLLGLLEHYGDRDHRKHGTASREDVKLVHLRDVVRRSDNGLHGNAFEHALHETVNGRPAIPESLRTPVVGLIGAEVGALYRQLDVPWTGWGEDGLRSVMWGVEKSRLHGADRLPRELDGGFVFPGGEEDAWALSDLLPVRGFRLPLHERGADRYAHPDLPARLDSIWRTDLFLGGAHVDRITSSTGCSRAWIPTTLKYNARFVEAGRGLQLAITAGHGRAASRGMTAVHRSVNGMPVLDLPLAGDFLQAFNSAYRVTVAMTSAGFVRRPHPTALPAWGQALCEELHKRKVAYVLDVAHSLLEERRTLTRLDAAEQQPRPVAQRLVPVPHAA